MRTNCLNSNHRGQRVLGGGPDLGEYGGYAGTYNYLPCHETMTGAWNNQRWNDVTPW
jgi:hypothetical protein